MIRSFAGAARLRSLGIAAALVATLAMLHAACGDSQSHAAPRPGPLGQTLAKIDDVVITVGDFQDRLNRQTPYVRARYHSLERKKEFLDNLVRFEVLAEEAQHRGLDKDPEVVRTMKQVMVEKLLQQQFDHQKMDDISDAQIEAYYNSHGAEFHKPAEVRVSTILVRDLRTAQRVLADPRCKGMDNAGFRSLVAQYSRDAATRDRGGDLRYFDAGSKDVPHAIVEAAFKLQNIGDVSPALKTPLGYAILKLTGRRKALARTLDEVKPQIRNQLFREERRHDLDAFVKSLRKKAHVQIDERRLAEVRVAPIGPGQFPGPGVPPPMPGAFHPGAPGAPQVTPARPGNPAAAGSIMLPPPDGPKAPPVVGATPPSPAS